MPDKNNATNTYKTLIVINIFVNDRVVSIIIQALSFLLHNDTILCPYIHFVSHLMQMQTRTDILNIIMSAGLYFRLIKQFISLVSLIVCHGLQMSKGIRQACWSILLVSLGSYCPGEPKRKRDCPYQLGRIASST